jgi:hypothetical protein
MTADQNNRIFDKANAFATTDGYVFDIIIDPTNIRRLRMILVTSNGFQLLQTAPSMTPPINELIHVAATYDGTRMNLYINGVVVATRPTTGTITTNTLPLRLGAASNGDGGFGGVLDELGVFSRALTATEIADIHAAGASGRCR